MNTITRKMRSSCLIASLSVYLIFSLPCGVLAHHTAVHGSGVNGNTQRSLTANAQEVWNQPFYLDVRKQDVRSGAVDEDNEWVMDHFYNPHTGQNIIPLHTTTAIQSARTHWDQAYKLRTSSGPASSRPGKADTSSSPMPPTARSWPTPSSSHWRTIEVTIGGARSAGRAPRTPARA